MKARQGDRIVVRSQHQGEPNREGEVLEVKGDEGAPPYWVQWSDTGHKGLYYPSADAYIAAAF